MKKKALTVFGILFLPILKKGGNLLKGVHDWD